MLNADLATHKRGELWPKVLSVLLLGCAVLVFSATFIAQVSRNPLRADEVDYFQCMQNVTALGLPLYYAGEVDLDPNRLVSLSEKRLGNREFHFFRFKPELRIYKETFFALIEGSSRFNYCLWHPPLYVYLGSLFMKVANLSPVESTTLRYFNLIFALGTLAGLAMISRRLYRRCWQTTFGLSVLLLATSSLAVRATLLVDYNGALGPCVAVWFAAAFLGEERSRRFLASGLVVAGITALALSSGLGIGAALILGGGLYAVFSQRSSGAAKSLVALGGGVLVFLGAFWGFSRLFGLPFSQPFLHNLQRVGDDLSLLSRMITALKYAAWYTAEIGMPTVILGGVLWIRLLVNQRSVAPRHLLPILILVGLLAQGSLKADAYGFPKYIAYLLPLLCVFISGEMMQILMQYASSALRLAASAVLVILVAFQCWHMAQVLRTPGGTLYYRGEQGFTAIVQDITQKTATDQILLSPKDIAFHAGRRFVEWHGSLLRDPNLLQRRLQQYDVEYIVGSQALAASASSDVTALLGVLYTPDVSIGDFVLWNRR